MGDTFKESGPESAKHNSSERIWSTGMSAYTYEAMDTHGKEVKSEIDAASEADALEKIRGLNLFPTKVNLKGGKGGGGGPGFHTPQAVAKKKGGGFSLSWRVKPKELTAFTRQFATLLDAGLPVVRS